MIKGLFNRTNNLSKASRISRRTKHVQANTTENSQILKTPPHKDLTKMITEVTITAKKPLQTLENHNVQTKVINQVPVCANKENEVPNNMQKSQKLPVIIKAKSQDKLKEMKTTKERTKSGSTLSQEDLKYHERVVEPIEIGGESYLDLDLMLEMDYGKRIEDDIFCNQPDFSNCLSQTEIKKSLRAKMVDWMIEVFGNYWQTTCHQTLFLAVSILDLYFKNTDKKVQDSDLHLAGIAAMFVATKYEDVYHIPLADFVSRVGHNKFSPDHLKSAEWEILKALDYNVSFPTVLTYFERLIYKNFHEDNCNMLKNIKEAAIHILKMCLHDYQFVNFPPLILALAVLCYCIKCYFYSLSEENTKNGNKVDLQEQETYLLQSILKDYGQIKIKEVETCMHRINELTHEFEAKFPGLWNLKKFSELKMR